MAWLALGGIGLIGILLLLRAFASASVETVRKAFAWGAAAFGVVLVLGLAFSGRLGQVLWTGMLFAPLGLRWARGLIQARRFGAGPAAGPRGESVVETATLAMRLDHASGEMRGVIRRGPQQGRELAALSLPETIAVLAACRTEDPDSVPLLEAWLDRLEPDWRAQDWQAQDGQAQGGQAQDGRARGRATGAAPPAGPGRMTRSEALEVLGLRDGADEAAIRAAHRRLMLAAHPDHGGSDWLAARINQARDVLLLHG